MREILTIHLLPSPFSSCSKCFRNAKKEAASSNTKPPSRVASNLLLREQEPKKKKKIFKFKKNYLSIYFQGQDHRSKQTNSVQNYFYYLSPIFRSTGGTRSAPAGTAGGAPCSLAEESNVSWSKVSVTCLMKEVLKDAKIADSMLSENNIEPPKNNKFTNLK